MSEVEFSVSPLGAAPAEHRNGRTYESIGLRPNQIMVLHFEPISTDAKSEMVKA